MTHKQSPKKYEIGIVGKGVMGRNLVLIMTDIGIKHSSAQMNLRISTGGVNMPACATNLTPTAMDALVA